DDERPDRRLQRRADRAGRSAGGDLRAPGHRVRRGVRRRLEHPGARRTPVHNPAREAADLARKGVRHRGARLRDGPDPRRRPRGQGPRVRRRARPRWPAPRRPSEPRGVVPGRARGAGPSRQARVAPRAPLHDRAATGGGRMRKARRYPLLVAVLALAVGTSFLTAGCGGSGGGGGGSSQGSGNTTSSGLPQSIGKGEGSLNVIEWTEYTDPSFANKFEQQTGCTIHRKDAGSSNQMVALMRQGGGGGGGQWDLVSASGDASLRLIKGGDVQAVNVNLIPSWKDLLPELKSPPHNTVNGVHYGVSLQWGQNILLYNTKKVKPAPTSWSPIYDSKWKGQITIPNNPIQIADPALYLSNTH